MLKTKLSGAALCVLSRNSEDLERMPTCIIFVYFVLGAKVKINKGFVRISSEDVLKRGMLRISLFTGCL